jgi:hypothetical protein
MTMGSTFTGHNRPRRRAGGALVLVTISLGVASILAMALLSSLTLQSQIGSNSAAAGEAEDLADSAVSVALYYLQNPTEWAGAMPDGHYPGEPDLALGALPGGTRVATEVRYDAGLGVYDVRADVRVPVRGGAAGSTLQRTVVARVLPVTSGRIHLVPLTDALVANGDLLLDSGMTVVGSPGGVRVLGPLTVSSGGRVIGDVVSDTITRSGLGEITGALQTRAQGEGDLNRALDALLAAAEQGSPVPGATVVAALAPPDVTDATLLVPPAANLPDLRAYRWRDPISGVTGTYAATKLSGTSYMGTVLGPTALNPAGIYWTDQETVLNTVTVNGTLVIVGGAKLRFGVGTNLIVAAPGYPAIVSDGELQIEGKSITSITGLVAARRVVTSGNVSLGSFAVLGALMLSERTNVFPSTSYSGTVTITYDADRAKMPGFGVAVPDKRITGFRIVSWTQSGG